MKHRSLIFLILTFFSGCVSLQESLETDGKVDKLLNQFEGEPVIPRNANRLFLPPITDNSGREVSGRLYIKIKENFSMDGRLAVVDSRESADVRLEVELSIYSVEKIAFDSLGVPVQKRLRLIAAARLTDLRRGKIIFHEPEIQAFQIFSEVTPPIRTESQALEDVLDELAKRIISTTITGWYTERMSPQERGKP